MGLGLKYSNDSNYFTEVAIYWALVSEPGFLDFQILRFPTFDICFVLRNIVGKYGGEISRKNNKGVLDRPWKNGWF